MKAIINGKIILKDRIVEDGVLLYSDVIEGVVSADMIPEGAEVIAPDFMGFIKFIATHKVTFNQLIKTDKLKAKLFNREDGNTQKIIFGENNLPKEIFIYNKNNELLSNFKITSLEENISVDDTLFDTNDTLETLNTYYQENPLTYDRTINYPTYYPEGTSLKEEVIKGEMLNKYAIMTFAGNVNYTITQKYLNNNEVQSVEYLCGDIYVAEGTFIVVDTNNITFYNEGIQYTIASNDIELIEMIKMANSFKTSDIK